MGGLLSMMKSSEAAGMILDFENAKPISEEEAAVHSKLEDSLVKAEQVITELDEYEGCGELIQKAISSPTDENLDAAWEAVVPAVEKLKNFYEYSSELEKGFPDLILSLCASDPKARLANQQALAKQLGAVFDFVLRFDDIKMNKPAIQNDFSYYRRSLNRMKLQKQEANLSIKDELANRMSLFYAYPTPTMKLLTDCTVKFLKQDDRVPQANVTVALATVANVCKDMLKSNQFESRASNIFCLRAMTGAVIMFDHLDKTGAFHKKTPIHIKAVVQTLQEYDAGADKMPLVNALRFTTAHLSDPSTPQVIRDMLEAAAASPN